MSCFEIRSATVSDVMDHPRFGPLIEQYAKECANPAMGAPAPNREQYETLAEMGMLHALGAYDGEELVGFISYLLTPMTHFSACAATTESLFLSPEYRRGLLGVRLIKAALNQAVSQGAKGLYVTAPAGSQLERLARVMKLKHTNTVFFVS